MLWDRRNRKINSKPGFKMRSRLQLKLSLSGTKEKATKVMGASEDLTKCFHILTIGRKS